MSKSQRRLAGVVHPLFGRIAVEPAEGTVFDPHAVFLDPGMLPRLLRFWAGKAARDGVGAGLPPQLRKAAREEAAQRALRLFTTRDYAAAGIHADAVAIAILSTTRWMQRAQWREDAEDRSARGDGKRGWFPWNRAQDCRTVDPSRLVAAWEGDDDARAALTGEGCDEAKTGTVRVPGGKRQPPGHGKMVRTERIVREWVEAMPMVAVETLAAGGGLAQPQPIPFAEIVTGWRMDRRRGKAQRYEACAVTVATDCREERRFHPAPTPTREPWTADDHAAIVNRVPAAAAGWSEVIPCGPNGEPVNSRARHWIRLRG